MFFLFGRSVLEKFVPIELILGDRILTDLYIQDSLERQSAHSLLRALITAIEDVFPKPLSRATLPVGVLLQSATNVLEKRVKLRSGVVVWVHSETRVVRPVFPEHFTCKSVFICNHTIDRGSTGAALVHFAVSSGVLWSIFWGVFHDMWNSIKNAAKAADGGKVWGHIANINHGPLRSGQWRRLKDV